MLNFAQVIKSCLIDYMLDRTRVRVKLSLSGTVSVISLYCVRFYFPVVALLETCK